MSGSMIVLLGFILELSIHVVALALAFVTWFFITIGEKFVHWGQPLDEFGIPFNGFHSIEDYFRGLPVLSLRERGGTFLVVPRDVEPADVVKLEIA
jgi:hypothetical protein